MSFVIFADGWWKLAITLGVVIGGVVLNAIKEAHEAKNRKRKFGGKIPDDAMSRWDVPRGNANRPAQATVGKDNSHVKSETLRSGQKPQKVKLTRKPADDSAPTHQAKVSKRHLTSAIESRHSETVHSDLEKKHLESAVSTRTVVGDDLGIREAPESALDPARMSGPASIISMLGASEQLTRAFMLSEVLGPPKGFK